MVTSQSRVGCLTCKARRVKCDEAKPACLRCTRSHRVCDGYPIRVRFYESGSAKLLPRATEETTPAIKAHHPPCELPIGLQRNSQQDRFARLGCEVIACDALLHFGSQGRNILQVLIPQFSHAIPSVNAAAAALGAVYAVQIHNLCRPREAEACAAQLYLVALQSLRDDLKVQRHGPLPPLIASILLSFGEIIMNKPDNALTHLLGAYRTFERLRQTSGHVECIGDNPGELQGLEKDLALMFRLFDYEVVTVALPRPPDLPPLPTSPVIDSMRDVSAAWESLIPRIHVAYHFISRACVFKYCPQLAPRPLLIEQGRHIGQLTMWLETLDHDLLPQFTAPLDSVPTPLHAHALLLRISCLSALVSLSTIFTSHECSYDTQATRFQQIITDATRIITSRATSSPTLPIPHGPRFSPGPGVIYPLVMSAVKYRNPRWRHRALDLLRHCGREGPYFGPRVYKVVQHCIDVEESWRTFHPTGSIRSECFPPDPLGYLSPDPDPARSPDSLTVVSLSPDHPNYTPTSSSATPTSSSSSICPQSHYTSYPDTLTVPELHRIHIAGFDKTSHELAYSDLVVTKFGRCRDIDGMVAASDEFVGLSLYELKALASGEKGAEGVVPRTLPPTQEGWWEVWEVTFEFLRGSGVQSGDGRGQGNKDGGMGAGYGDGTVDKDRDRSRDDEGRDKDKVEGDGK